MAELKALLDTNIIIHRENNRLTNDSIGVLYNWLDKLHYSKCIHQCSIDEIHKHKDNEYKKLLDVKMDSYVKLEKFDEPSEEFSNKLSIKYHIKNENDITDNQLLYEVYQKRVNLLITEDNGIIDKAISLGIADRVVSIDDFIADCKEKNPELKEYKFNSVFLTKFGNVDLRDSFFDSLRDSYGEKDFNEWYNRKKDESAYVHYNLFDELSGFLYIKIEYENEDYNDIVPKFEPKKRLKVGTFKVVSTGYRLGERFLQIIFDNAIRNEVDEIYVTMFDNSDELIRLKGLLMEWGFEEYGLKNGKEKVLVKSMTNYDSNKTIKQNFPIVNYQVKKLFLPIEPQFHTRLFPDSALNREKVDYDIYLGYKFAIEKCYISFSYKTDFKKGDIVLIYRKGLEGEKKAFKSVISSICVINEIYRNINSKEQLISLCGNRSVFNQDELNNIWNNRKRSIQIVKLLYIMPLKTKVILSKLWETKIVELYKGPRSFDDISDEQFDIIIENGNTKLYRYK